MSEKTSITPFIGVFAVWFMLANLGVNGWASFWAGVVTLCVLDLANDMVLAMRSSHTRGD